MKVKAELCPEKDSDAAAGASSCGGGGGGAAVSVSVTKLNLKELLLEVQSDPLVSASGAGEIFESRISVEGKCWTIWLKRFWLHVEKNKYLT